MRIETALERFITQLQADGRSPHTIGQYQRHVCLFAHWVADVGPRCDIKRVSHEHVAHFLSSPHAQTSASGGPKKTGSVNALRTSLKCFFSYLHRAGYIPTDPGRLIRRAICGRPLPRALSDDEATRLMAVLQADDTFEGQRDFALFHLLLASGIRLQSALTLQVEDVNLSASTLRIRAAKGNREEQIFLNDEILDHLRRFIGTRTTGPLFTTRRSQRPCARHVQRRCSLWIKKAQITSRMSCHSLRHTFGLKVYRLTGDLLLTKEAMHHRSVSSTLAYVHVDQDRLRHAVQLVAPHLTTP